MSLEVGILLGAPEATAADMAAGIATAPGTPKTLLAEARSLAQTQKREHLTTTRLQPRGVDAPVVRRDR